MSTVSVLAVFDRPGFKIQESKETVIRKPGLLISQVQTRGFHSMAFKALISLPVATAFSTQSYHNSLPLGSARYLRWGGGWSQSYCERVCEAGPHAVITQFLCETGTWL